MTEHIRTEKEDHAHFSETHAHAAIPGSEAVRNILTIRSHSGLSGDMLLTGLALLAMDRQGLEPLTGASQTWLDQQLGKISPALAGSVKIGQRKIGGIAGWHAFVELPDEHHARGLAEILKIIADSGMADSAKKNAEACFELLAHCEAAAHGILLEQVHFHEVGALDSILDICGVCAFYDLLGEPELVCGSLPLADGFVRCNHGILPTPAPAVLPLLKGVLARGVEAAGEMVTPTAMALLQALNAAFGCWPSMRVWDARLVYGGKTFEGIANGATFVLGARECACA